MGAFISENTQFIGTNGKPLVGGKIYIGIQNLEPVANPTDIFSNRALSIALANPQTLDTLGKPTNKIWIGIDKYSVRVDNSSDVQQFQELDNGTDTQIGTTKLSNVQGTTTVTADAATTIIAYVDLQQFVFTAVGSNTGTMTMDIDGVGAKTIDGTSAAGTIVNNQVVSLYFSTTNDAFTLGITPTTDLLSPGPIGTTTPSTIDGTIIKADTSFQGVSGAVITTFETTLSSSATKVPTSSAVTTKINTLPLAGSIDQESLKTTTGDVSTSSTSLVLITGAGGDYGFWPTIKTSSAAAARISVSPVNHVNTASASTYATDSLNIGTTLLQRFTLGTVPGSTGALTVRSRFVQACPPYDIGDGEVHSFIFLLLDSQDKILAGYHAPDPPWANNGPTCIHSEWIDLKTGKEYRKHCIIDESKAFEDPDRRIIKTIEITSDFKNSDMAIIPHSFLGNDMQDKSIVLIDPNDRIVEIAEQMKEDGELALEELFHNDYIRFGNEHMQGRKTPHNSVMVVKPTWRNTP